MQGEALGNPMLASMGPHNICRPSSRRVETDRGCEASHGRRVTGIREVYFGHVAACGRPAARREARVNLTRPGISAEKRAGGRAEQIAQDEIGARQAYHPRSPFEEAPTVE